MYWQQNLQILILVRNIYLCGLLALKKNTALNHYNLIMSFYTFITFTLTTTFSFSLMVKSQRCPLFLAGVIVFVLKQSTQKSPGVDDVQTSATAEKSHHTSVPLQNMLLVQLLVWYFKSSTLKRIWIRVAIWSVFKILFEFGSNVTMPSWLIAIRKSTNTP